MNNQLMNQNSYLCIANQLCHIRHRCKILLHRYQYRGASIRFKHPRLIYYPKYELRLPSCFRIAAFYASANGTIK